MGAGRKRKRKINEFNGKKQNESFQKSAEVYNLSIPSGSLSNNIPITLDTNTNLYLLTNLSINYTGFVSLHFSAKPLHDPVLLV